MKRDDLAEKTVKELRTLAVAKGVANANKLVKAELIDALAPAPKTKAKAKPASKGRPESKRASFTAPKSSKTLKAPPMPAGKRSSTSLVQAKPPLPTVAASTAPDPGLPIPAHYGHDRLVLLVQDSHHLFAYWELQGGTVSRVQAAVGGACTPVLAIHSSGNTEFREVDLRGGNYYLAVAPDRHYEAELALRDGKGQLHTLARSNRVTTPAPSISARVDEQWMGVDETFHELLQLAGLPGHLRGTSSAARLADQRLAAWSWQHGGTPSLSSGSLSSRSLVKPAPGAKPNP